MKWIVLLLVIVTGCTTTNEEPRTDPKDLVGGSTSWFIVNPTPMHLDSAWGGRASAKELYDNFEKCETATTQNPVTVNNQKYDNPSTCYLSLLTNSNSDIVIRKIESGLETKVATSTVSAKGDSYEVSMNWSKFTWMREPELKSTSNEQVEGDEALYKIGVGVSIVAKIYNTSAGIDLTDLPSIAIAAQTSESRGTVSFERIGINGKVTEMVFPGLTKDLSPETLSTAFDGVQKIQLLLYSDKDVVLKPSVLGYRLPEKAELDESAAGWLYIGHYPNETSLLSGFHKISAINGSPKISELVDKVVKVTEQKSLRVDKPRFPSYSIPAAIESVPANCELKVLELNSVGLSKYWALVSKVRNCDTK
ncbi:hypothetical protein EXU30_08420 [Shewanella maritima]|uniref:Uncharacterized protein n=1 Tax=Shewanella maritima TaxID=2520507 RepID=A0A411PH78_9GAMM|nr:hypothetical protein [Shewanella maritima]QBF82710.1 hypothetical protein EXU30_08420 [Shewanella maritima]